MLHPRSRELERLGHQHRFVGHQRRPRAHAWRDQHTHVKWRLRADRHGPGLRKLSAGQSDPGPAVVGVCRLNSGFNRRRSTGGWLVSSSEHRVRELGGYLAGPRDPDPPLLLERRPAPSWAPKNPAETTTHRLLLETLWQTGARVQEVLRLRPGDVVEAEGAMTNLMQGRLGGCSRASSECGGALALRPHMPGTPHLSLGRNARSPPRSPLGPRRWGSGCALPPAAR